MLLLRCAVLPIFMCTRVASLSPPLLTLALHSISPPLAHSFTPHGTRAPGTEAKVSTPLHQRPSNMSEGKSAPVRAPMFSADALKGSKLKKSSPVRESSGNARDDDLAPYGECLPPHIFQAAPQAPHHVFLPWATDAWAVKVWV